MKRFSSIYSRSEKVQKIVKNIKEYKEPLYIKGLSGSSLSLISSVTCELTEDFTHIFLFEDKQKAEKEAQRVAEEEKRAAEEAEKRRKIDCEELIQEAVRLKNNEKYSDALKKLKKAVKQLS